MSAIQDLIRLADVKRWHIVGVGKEQSVAEHSALVAYIARDLCIRINRPDLIYETLVWALFHDSNESVTGDIPSPVSRVPSVQFAISMISQQYCPWYHEYEAVTGDEAKEIVKLADTIEAYNFLAMYSHVGGGTDINYVRDKYMTIKKKLTIPGLKNAADQVLDEIFSNEHTIVSGEKSPE